MSASTAGKATPVLLIASDKYRGTLTAVEVAETVASAATECGWRPIELPLSDGGEGLLSAFGEANRVAQVTGPHGRTVAAPWRLDTTFAVVESAVASGLLLAGGPEHNDPLAATSRGTGELIAEAIAAGATDVLVGLGGSACTDGGLGALEALTDVAGDSDVFTGARVTLCADVTTRFLEAAATFGPQKGATPQQVRRLQDRLRSARAALIDRFGRDPQPIPGSGAAGGLAGGLAAAGATIVAGFDHMADRLGLDDHLRGADLVITGEGRLDESSLQGKVVGGVVTRSRWTSTPVVAIVGDRDPGCRPEFPVHALTEEHGPDAALERTRECLRSTTHRVLTSRGRASRAPGEATTG